MQRPILVITGKKMMKFQHTGPTTFFNSKKKMRHLRELKRTIRNPEKDPLYIPYHLHDTKITHTHTHTRPSSSRSTF